MVTENHIPTIESAPAELETDEGAALHISVKLKANPEPVVRWMRNSKLIVPGAHYQVRRNLE